MRRVLVVIAVILVVIVGGIIDSYLTWSATFGRWTAATGAGTLTAQCAELQSVFAAERPLMLRYLAAADGGTLAGVRADHARFTRLSARLSPQTATGRAALARARSAEAAAYAAFGRAHPVTGGASGPSGASEASGASGASGAAIGHVDAQAAGATAGLSDLTRAEARHEAVVRGLALAAARSDLRMEMISDAVSICLAIGFAYYVLTLIRQGHRRERELGTTLRRLGDRDQLLGRLRSTSSVLSEVAGDLRAAAGDAAAATSQQSSAVAQTSATIEELAATSGTVTDHIQAVARAAGNTGETMQDMRLQVEAIAARALSLGERAQRVGEILELINDIAAQTNLLAINAAIEAARAGDAGRGFGVVADQVRRLAERSVESTAQIGTIISVVRDETNATIMATEKGTHQAREVAELMTTTAAMLEESILSIQQQKSAADQADEAIGQIREATHRLTVRQAQWQATSARLESLVADLDGNLHGGASLTAAPVGGAAAGGGVVGGAVVGGAVVGGAVVGGAVVGGAVAGGAVAGGAMAGGAMVNDAPASDAVAGGAARSGGAAGGGVRVGDAWAAGARAGGAR